MTQFQLAALGAARGPSSRYCSGSGRFHWISAAALRLRPEKTGPEALIIVIFDIASAAPGALLVFQRPVKARALRKSACE